MYGSWTEMCKYWWWSKKWMDIIVNPWGTLRLAREDDNMGRCARSCFSHSVRVGRTVVLASPHGLHFYIGGVCVLELMLIPLHVMRLLGGHRVNLLGQVWLVGTGKWGSVSGAWSLLDLSRRGQLDLVGSCEELVWICLCGGSWILLDPIGYVSTGTILLSLLLLLLLLLWWLIYTDMV